MVNVTQELYRSGQLDGIISLGGSLGTALSTTAMRSLPFGIPKVMVSTIAYREMRPYIGTKDIAMLYSVTDIVGINILSRRLLSVAAGAVVGMVMADPGPQTKEKPVVSENLATGFFIGINFEEIVTNCYKRRYGINFQEL